MLWRIFIRMATPLAFFRNAFLGIVGLTPLGNHVRHIVSSQDDAVAGRWDADHDRPRTRNARHSNAQYNNICISKSPTFSLRTQILPLADIRLAAHRKYTVRQIRQKTPVAPLCEWKNLRAERLNSTSLMSTSGMPIRQLNAVSDMNCGAGPPCTIMYAMILAASSNSPVASAAVKQKPPVYSTYLLRKHATKINFLLKSI